MLIFDEIITYLWKEIAHLRTISCEESLGYDSQSQISSYFWWNTGLFMQKNHTLKKYYPRKRFYFENLKS